jgi:hypothetical protein
MRLVKRSVVWMPRNKYFMADHPQSDTTFLYLAEFVTLILNYTASITSLALTYSGRIIQVFTQFISINKPQKNIDA